MSNCIQTVFMKIHIIWLGKTKDSYMQEGLKEYLKRLQTYAQIEISELKEESLKDSIEVVKDREAEKILNIMKDDCVYLSLDQYGKQYDSVSFSKAVLNDYGQMGKIGFIIGGVYGLSDVVRDKTKLISFSKLTFTHQMIRVILLEQVYRAFTIEKNKRYHY